MSFENWTLSNLLNIKHKPINAHAIGVGFWCKFDIQGSPEPQNSNEANESSRFFVYISDYNLEWTINQIINQRSVPKIRQRVGENIKTYEKISLIPSSIIDHFYNGC